MLREKSLKRNHWPIAKLSDVKKGIHGLVKVVTLMLPPLKGSLKERTLIRSIHDLDLLDGAQSHDGCCIIIIMVLFYLFIQYYVVLKEISIR